MRGWCHRLNRFEIRLDEAFLLPLDSFIIRICYILQAYINLYKSSSVSAFFGLAVVGFLFHSQSCSTTSFPGNMILFINLSAHSAFQRINNEIRSHGEPLPNPKSVRVFGFQ